MQYHAIVEPVYTSKNFAFNCREKTVTGEDIRRVIQSSVFQPANHVRGRAADFDDLDIPIGQETTDLKYEATDNDYLDCYCIPLWGKMQKERWIKYTAPEVKQEEEHADDQVMVVLTKEVIFVKVEVKNLPRNVVKPPALCSCYAVDVENKFALKHFPSTPAENTADDTLKRVTSLPALNEPLPVLPPLPQPMTGSVDNILSQPLPQPTTGSLDKISSQPLPQPATGSVDNVSPSHGKATVKIRSEPAPPVPPKPSNLPTLALKPTANKSRWEKLSDNTLAASVTDDSVQPPPRSSSKKRPVLKPDDSLQTSSKEHCRPNSTVETNMDDSLPTLPARPRSLSPTKIMNNQGLQWQLGDKSANMSETNISSDSTSTSNDNVYPPLPRRLYKENRMYDDRHVPVTDSLNDLSELHDASKKLTDGGVNEEKFSTSQERGLDGSLKYMNNVIEEENLYEPIESRNHVSIDNGLSSDWFVERMDHLSDEAGSSQRLATSEEGNSLDGRTGAAGVSEDTSRSSSVDGQKSPSNDSGLEANLTSPVSDTTIKGDGKGLKISTRKISEALHEIHVLANEASSDGDSYYEHIDALNSDGRYNRKVSAVAYLDPHDSWADVDALHDIQSPSYKPFPLFCDVELEPEFVTLPAHSLLLASIQPAYSEDNSMPLSDTEINQFKNTCLSFDKKARCFYIPLDSFKIFGDPREEPWFYPVKLSSRQATLFISEIQQEGCFIVYEPIHKIPGVVYNLSVGRENGDVLHYHIKKNIRGDLVLEGHERVFMTLKDLVEYFQRNRSRLAVRLRRPLKYALVPILAGHQYDAHWEIDRTKLRMSGKIIGKGNFGVVCLGTYCGESVAVKVLQKVKQTAEDEDAFIEEAQVLMRLHYDHVVRLIGLSCSMRPFYLVTEFVKKGNLRDCLRESLIPSNSMDMLFDFCLQAAAALLYLENQRFILHRDIAARNFLVSNDLCIKLADFGRARYVTDDIYQAPRTETLSIKWAAPEVLSHSLYSSKSDLWALGIVFWEIFSRGERPYSSMSSEQAAMFVMDGGRPEKPAGCPTDLFTLMKTCWQEQPDLRPTFASFYNKLSSKSNIYYSGPMRTVPQHNYRGAVAQPIDVNLPKLPISTSSLNKSKTITGHGRSPDSRRKTLLLDSKTNMPRNEATKSLVMNSANRTHTDNRKSFPESSSETSLGTEREDLSRGDKIRKSLRKMMSLKPKTKTVQVDLMQGTQKKQIRKSQSP